MEKEVVRYGLISTSQIGVNAQLPASLDSKNSEMEEKIHSFHPAKSLRITPNILGDRAI